jgi:hypothetical protein
LSHTRFLAVLLALCLTAGCKAQTASDPALDRRIEVTVRSQFNIPQDYNVTLGARKPSSVSGYDDLPITLTPWRSFAGGQLPHLCRRQEVGAP